MATRTGDVFFFLGGGGLQFVFKLSNPRPISGVAFLVLHHLHLLKNQFVLSLPGFRYERESITSGHIVVFNGL